MAGGWLLAAFTYKGLLPGLMNGLKMDVCRSNVASRKLTDDLLMSHDIFRVFAAKILVISSLIFDCCLTLADV